jgi:hypothetical protein
MRLDGASEYHFVLSGYSREAFTLHELAQDVMLYRNGVMVFRGRLGTSEDQIDTDRHDLPFYAIDYRGLLDRRHLLEPVRFDQWNQADMAWWMVNYTQTRPHGEMGIVRGATGGAGQPLRDRSYDAGKPIAEALGQLGRVIDGFNWDVDPMRRFNVYYPQRGISTGAVLEYGTHISRLRRAWLAPDYANVVIGTGAEGTQPIVLSSPQLGQLPQGRIEGLFSDEDISVWDTLYRYTLAALNAGADPIGGYQVELSPGAYDARNMVLGNAYQVRVRSGRLDFERTLRIQEIEISITDDGEEQVVLTLGKPPGSEEQRFRQIDARLAALQRTGATRTYQLANVAARAAGERSAVVVSAEVDIGELPSGAYGIRVDGELEAPRGINYGPNSARRQFFNWYPAAPQWGDVVFIPR